MAFIKVDENRKLARTIEQRAGAGPSEIVAGWQSMLQDMLDSNATLPETGVHRHLPAAAAG